MSVAPRSGGHSRSSIKPPASSNTEGCSRATKSSLHPQIPSGTRPSSDENDLSTSPPRPSLAQTSSLTYARDLGQSCTPKTSKTPKKRTSSDIEDDYKRDKKKAKLLPPDEQKTFKKSLHRVKRAEIASLIDTPS
ncbi:uncharacterized protein N7483_008275 [Penicillium malachiteum]|uniref:uncharacterized protein n=1 Tax=Penicillium malachiteum TaxID=1324776 RepID=UPI002547563A|nr:uncharacterized protein N7483_008275 [Penicillium malachiteum]KAJ5720341.1 hypothetical protein N7483_008275 [Penicillium malachiteum]